MNVIDRFMSKVDKSGDCWIWMARKTPQGYGRFGYERRNWLAHRVSHALFVGPVDGLQVLHKCDNPSCVNPAHLFLGTNADNVADKVAKGRQSCLKGENGGNVKLKTQDVLSIRSMYSAGVSDRELASRYGVSRHHVWAIATRKAWRHV